jgi:hypothetical protein
VLHPCKFPITFFYNALRRNWPDDRRQLGFLAARAERDPSLIVPARMLKPRVKGRQLVIEE